MNAIYRAVGISKQNFHQRRLRWQVQRSRERPIVEMMHEVRSRHPQMCQRHMWRMLALEGVMGRDRFFELYRDNGFKLEQKPNYARTTDSRGVIRFPNLIATMELTGVNQVWVSDITYYREGNRFYYLTFIMDLYSRKIVGHSTSQSLTTEATTLPALKKALRGLSMQQTRDLIIHSDGGGQYYSRNFVELTNRWGMQNSMCKDVYENPHAERINRTIKNGYLRQYAPETYPKLKRMLSHAVRLYNTEKPHDSLSGLAPAQFEVINSN